MHGAGSWRRRAAVPVTLALALALTLGAAASVPGCSGASGDFEFRPSARCGRGCSGSTDAVKDAEARRAGLEDRRLPEGR